MVLGNTRRRVELSDRFRYTTWVEMSHRCSQGFSTLEGFYGSRRIRRSEHSASSVSEDCMMLLLLTGFSTIRGKSLFLKEAAETEWASKHLVFLDSRFFFC